MMSGWWGLAGWPTAEEWSAWWEFGRMLATFGTVLVGLGTLLVAGVAAWVALRQLRAYIAEQEERARPYLMADFWFKANSVLYVTLENISSTPATDVTMTSDPLPLSNRDAEYDAALAEVFGGSLVIPQVAPGAVMRWFIDSAHVLAASTDRPHRFEITVHYTDPRARASRDGEPKRYEDTFILDLDAFGYASGGDDHDNNMWQATKRNEKRLEAMSKSLTSVASTLDTLLGIDEAAKAARRREPMLARRRRRQEGRE